MSAPVTFTVRSGDTISAIAARLNLDPEALMRANGMDPALADGRVTRNRADPDRLMIGQQLTIPAATPGYESSHTVGRGDTLTSIASRWGVGLDSLLAANPQFNPALLGGGIETRRAGAGGFDPDALRIGDVIARPGSSSAPAAVRPQPRPQAPADAAVQAPVQAAPSPAVPPAAITADRIDLQGFLDPTRGGSAPAAIVIGNAEGTRTANGGFTSAYRSHTDPGNGVRNQGSFSYQHPADSAEAADRLQLQALTARVPAYEAAARAAGLDPNDARLASTYFDLYNQSPTAAARFLGALDSLRGQPLTADRMAQARFDSFVNPETGQRFLNPNGGIAGSGFAEIARVRNGGDTPTETQIQDVIRADQSRRTRAMEGALQAQGLVGAGASGGATTAPAPTPASALSRGATGTEVRALQDKLVELGYMTRSEIGAGAGTFGPRTEAAVKRFQAANGIQQTGAVGETTAAALAVAQPLPAQERTTAGTVWPVPGSRSINAADKPGEGAGEFGTSRSNASGRHSGLDIVGSVGDRINAFRPGTVLYAGSAGTLGNVVVVDHGNGLHSVYAHLDSTSVRVGQEVAAGAKLGEMGRTGNTPRGGDTHLHFEIRENAGNSAFNARGFVSGTAVDPLRYLQP